jgi:hypothetical protein
MKATRDELLRDRVLGRALTSSRKGVVLPGLYTVELRGLDVSLPCAHFPQWISRCSSQHAGRSNHYAIET